MRRMAAAAKNAGGGLSLVANGGSWPSADARAAEMGSALPQSAGARYRRPTHRRTHNQ